MPPPPIPFHILRAHHAPISALHFTRGNTHLFAGDQDGVVSVTDLSARRVVASWEAHDKGVLSVGEWDGGVVSQGRDNKINFYARVPPGPRGQGAPAVVQTMPSNSLNFCQFSLAPLEAAGEALLALPNLTDSELIDIYHVPSLKRLHSAINYVPRATGPDAPRSGLVMSLHLHVRDAQVFLATGYEDGRVEVWSCGVSDVERMWDGRKGAETGEQAWKRLWEGKAHNEAVMAMAVDPAFTRAFTVSADHLLGRVDLSSVIDGTAEPPASVLTTYAMNQIGHASLATSHDGLVVGVGGWDGRIRLFSAATFKPLGTLAYHRESVQALAFAQPPTALLLEGGTGGGDDDNETVELGAESDSDDDDGAGDAAGPRDRWLASGGKDRRIGLWALMDFGAGGRAAGGR
ncbi:Astra associated protein 1 Asa1 [Vanrija albida]|uniref:ASTRA-associated protein 1 n=1 Tax=Vanrija albida TaxID=181172 RepID=A0ABR3PTV0_9TREE